MADSGASDVGGGPPAGFAGQTIAVRELSDVLLRDVGGGMAGSGRWPLVIDPSGQAATFLRYRDCNCLVAMNPVDLEAERIRMSLIGALRFGKPLVVDMMDVNLFDLLTDRFAEVRPNLMDDVLSKRIMEEKCYLPLVKKSDGDEYDKYKFADMFLENFKFVLITKCTQLPAEVLNKFYPIWVKLAA